MTLKIHVRNYSKWETGFGLAAEAVEEVGF